MKHAAALIVAITIAATPVSTLVCVAWCAPDGSPVSATCHHHMGGAATVSANDADDTCARLFASSPYVKEEIQLTARAVMPASAPPASFVPAPGETLLAFVRDVVPTVHHRSIFALVLRL